MSITTLLFVAFGAAVSPAAESKDFAAVEREFKATVEKANRPFAPALELLEKSEPPKVHAPDFLGLIRRPQSTDSPRLLRPSVVPEMKMAPDGTPYFPWGKVKRYTPERRGNPLPAPFEDFEMIRLGGEKRRDR